ncbi:hypothetical protein [Pelistega sp. MC2]|uniref:hypothetical protein n=1 Tax=Pelistega sp. MC2 TaxID=1720297 RepID=UPI0008D9F523|nr:hypothetical protein [Pelistega sp. MC2]
MHDWLKWLNEYIPSFIGSASSLLWMDGSVTRKFFMFLVGFYVGYHAGIYFNELTHVPLTLSWIAMGLYSVSVISKGYDAIANMSLLDFIPGLKRKFGGDK